MTVRPSLQNRLLMLTLTAVVCTWLLAAIITWFNARHELDEVLDGHLAQAAALLVTQQAHDIAENDKGIEAPALHKYAPKVMFQVFHEGQLSLRSANAPSTPILDKLLEFQSGFTTIQILGENWRVFTTYGAEKDIQVYVAEEVQARTSILWAVLRSMFLPFIVTLPLLAITLWLAIRRGMNPIRTLGKLLEQRQPSALNPIALNDSSIEMQPVIQALNGLFERMKILMESERRFTADAAHELRTPLAALRIQAQVALAECDETKRQHALQNTLEACDRTSRLVEQLLTLSRLENNTEPAFSDFDIVAMVRKQVAEIAPKAIGKQQNIEFDANHACIINGNEVLLAVLVRNLLDNAVRYCPTSTQIFIRLRCINEQCVLIIEDSGNGLTDQNMVRLGERFFRIKSNEESGSGLGWSIVKRIAAAHHFELQVCRSEKLGGLCVRLIAAAKG